MCHSASFGDGVVVVPEFCFDDGFDGFDWGVGAFPVFHGLVELGEKGG
jgi:hypothetical protein